MIQSRFDGEEKLQKFKEDYYSELGIELITFSADKRGHYELEELMKLWSEQIGPLSREPSFIDEKERYFSEE